MKWAIVGMCAKLEVMRNWSLTVMRCLSACTWSRQYVIHGPGPPELPKPSCLAWPPRRYEHGMTVQFSVSHSLTLKPRVPSRLQPLTVSFSAIGCGKAIAKGSQWQSIENPHGLRRSATHNLKASCSRSPLRKTSIEVAVTTH